MSLSFKCALCSQVLRQPCCLVNCGHVFCFECLVDKVTQRPDDEAVSICPSCHVSSGCSSIEEMKKELREPVTETLIELVGNEKISQMKSPNMCGGEDCEGRAESWCPECKGNLCKTCLEEHSKVRFLKSHKVVPLSQKKVEIFGECSSCQTKTTGFCETCEKAICPKCAFQGHKEHEVNDLVVHLNTRREGLRKFIEEVRGSLID
eukprot:TRINITY_DN734_c1_g1_i1.p1 TRINITY_DN734_c1_g1~~TRINITY_DN734_c1_g1_i1.p1  ORF type:complete len:206 (+),score=51.94 TRINITY_DN734_c1_g1_i1:84-701(+)